MREFGTVVGAGRLAIVGLGVALLGAQQPKPLFRAATRLVEVSVTVVDKKGLPVTGLRSADFEVFDQGKARAVAICRFDGAPAAATREPAASPLPEGTFTNVPSASGDAPPQVAALVLDHINTPPRLAVNARAQMMRYLSALAPRTATAVYLLANQLYALHDFSDDAEGLRARVEKLTLPASTARETDDSREIIESERLLEVFGAEFKQFFSEGLRASALAAAIERHDRMERSLAQVEALGMHMAGIPGRKSLVWIGGGFSMASVTATTIGVRSTPELVESYEEEVRGVSRRLAQLGIVLYIVDANRVEAPPDTRAQSPRPLPQPGRGNFELFADTAAVSSDTKSAMQAIASITGGRYFYPEDRTAVDKVVADLQSSYTLGFYVDEPDGRWHKLKVQVRRPGLRVQHREGYLAESRAAQPAAWTEERWRAALSNPVASSALPLIVTGKRTASGDVAVSVLADTTALQFVPDGENLKATLEILVGDRTAEGPGRSSRSTVTRSVPAAQWQTARLQPTRYGATWKPAADATALRVIVHDTNSGRYGSLDVPLGKVPRDRPD
jgi:VWFA-related protein